MTKDELYHALKYIDRKKQATRQQINEALKSAGKDLLLNDKQFIQCVTLVSEALYAPGGQFTSQNGDTFELKDQGKDLLADFRRERRASKRANLALALSLAAVLISAVALVYNILVL